MAYTKYSLTPANNTAAPPDGAPEGMLPSAVNDTMRDMMAQIRDCGDGIRDGTYTMTTPKITGGTITGAAFTGNTFTSPVISGGTINNATIGATTATTGKFTTLEATGATTFSGATVVSASLTANTFSSSGATITGGSVTGITDLAIADGGTGASTAAGARTNLGLDGFVNMKNRIINGAMVIAQRTTSAVTANDSYAVDRWNIGNSTDGSFSAIQDSDAPAGFNKSVKFTITTADASVTGTQSLFMVQPIEGFNTADLNWGSATNAKTVTLSFWVKSSVTGTFSGSLMNGSVNRAYPFTYTISAANTWEQKSVTVAGDTTGTWNTDNSSGILLYFSLGTGSTRLGTAGAWAGSRLQGATGETALVNTLNATWFITGIQLEVGSTSTSFDYRPYGTELALCQRYYYGLSGSGVPIMIGQAYTTSAVIGAFVIPTEMRTTPTLSYNSLDAWTSTGSASGATTWTIDSGSSNKLLRIGASGGSGLVAGNASGMYFLSGSSYFNLSAEL